MIYNDNLNKFTGIVFSIILLTANPLNTENMPLTYALYPNNVLKDKNTYRALIKDRRHYTLEEVIARMTRNRSAAQEAEIKGIFELFTAEVESILKEGGSVLTPLFNAQCSIAGRFTGAEDYFFRNRHRVRINLTPGSRLKALAGEIKTQKTESKMPRPLINSFTNMLSGEINSGLNPGGPAILKGARLNFDPNDPEQGVRFVDDNQTTFRVSSVISKTFSQLVFLIPTDMPPGNYRLQVNNKLKTKIMRTGELNHTLVVGETLPNSDAES